MTDRNRIDTLVSALEKSNRAEIPVNDAGAGASLPSRAAIATICRKVLGLLFPGFFDDHVVHDLGQFFRKHLSDLHGDLMALVPRAQRFMLRNSGKEEPKDLDAAVARRVDDALDDLVRIRALVATDVEAAYRNDPAATNREVIVASYPCVEALAVQRFANGLYRREIPLIPRMMTEVVHSHTGIDIHPGATIDESFFIDHGTGVVIGETCTIGKNCVIYHGVTLGAWNPLTKDGDGELKRGHDNKRHPDLEDHVTVYPGATILGGTTRIGHHSVIGGNVWLTESVEPFSVVTIKDPELNIRKRKVDSKPKRST